MAKRLNTFFRTEVADMLKTEGFIHRGNSFLKETPPLVFELTLEKHRWNIGESIQFWIALKIYMSKEDAPRFTLNNWISNFSLIFAKRIGYLWGEEHYMYSFPADNYTKALNTQVQKNFDQYLFPLLHRISTLNDLMNYLDLENQKLGFNFFSFTLAIGLARIGKLEMAKKYFQQSIGDKMLIKKTAANFNIKLE